MLINFFNPRVAIAIALLLLTGIVTTSWILISDSEQVIEENAQLNAEELTRVLQAFRKLYTSEVVNRLNDHDVTITHDYQKHEKAIPLPATLTQMLADEIGELGHGESARLYSDHPFSTREKDTFLDNFEQEALKKLREKPNVPFGRMEVVNGVKTYRYAIADIMKRSCVGCHNSHPDSPKRDWKVGDVRGVFEVNFPAQGIADTSGKEMKKDIILIVAITIIAASLLILFIVKLTRIKETLETLVSARTAELKKREKHFSSIIDNTAEAIITIDEQGSIISFNKAAETIFGYKRKEIINQNIMKLMPEKYHSAHQASMTHHIETGKSTIIGVPTRVEGMRKDSTVFPLEVLISEGSNSDKKVFIGVLRDVTEEEYAQQAIQAEKARLKSVIDNVIDGIITISDHGLIEAFNPAAEAMFGYTFAEVNGKNINILMPEPYHSNHDGYLSNYRTTGEKKIIGTGREVVGLRKDGSTFPMELAVSSLKIGEVVRFVGIVRDITERKAFEQKIIDEKRQLAAVFDNVVDGIITISERGTIESFNPAANKVFGYSDEEVIGQNVNMLMPEPYHSAHDGYLDSHLRTGEKRVIGIGREVTGQRKDGTTFPMELAVSEVVIDNVRHFVGITRDITERKQAEQMQKEFVSTVSHELRTPLTSIRGSLGLILGGVTGELPEKAEALLTIANNNSERLILLINDILDMEKLSAGKMQFDYTEVNLTTLVEHSLDANKGYGDQLNISFLFKDESTTEIMVRVDEKRMEQVMSNLLSNAAKYSPTNDSVMVSVQRHDESARITVHDNGKGIPDEFKSRIFNKFSQADSSDTRQKGGTGLGLNITKEIVEQHGGSIGFESNEGRGTTFFVDLPLVKKESETSMPIESPDLDKSLILIVEDDKDVSKLLSMMLEKEGYISHQAFDYQSALKQLEKHNYDAITLDLMIPGGSGISLLRQLRSNDATKDIPVIVVSARASDGSLKVEGNSLEVVDWVEKPINEKQLLESLRSGLTHAGSTAARILHVEDDHDVAQIIDSLTGQEYQITHATTLEQAKQLIHKEAFDLLLLDIGLPDGSGLDLLPLLHTHERQIPVVIFSALDVSEDIIAQVDSVLVKSKTDNVRLMKQIKTAIDKK